MERNEEPKGKERQCFCPYCEEEMLIPAPPYCQACGVTVFYCPECRKPLPRGNEVCPHCGAEIRG